MLKRLEAVAQIYFPNIHKKTPVLSLSFRKVVNWQPAALLKKRPGTGFFL